MRIPGDMSAGHGNATYGINTQLTPYCQGRNSAFADMVRMMADENVTVYEHNPKIIIQTMRVAKRFLKDNSRDAASSRE